MSDALLLGIGGVVLLFAISGMVVFGIMYSKSNLRDQIGERFPGFDHQEQKPGTPV